MAIENEGANVEQVAAAPETTINPTYTEALEEPGKEWEEQTEEVEAEGSEKNEEAAEPQDAETNSKFAAMRREYEAKMKAAEDKARDEMVNKIYGETHGIHTYAEYEKALKQAQMEEEAEENGLDPQTYSKMKELEAKVQSYERKEAISTQVEKLTNDPVTAPIYKKYKSEIDQVAASHGIDLQTAFTFIVGQKLPEIISGTTQETVKKINDNGRSSPGSLSKPGTPTTSAWDMSEKDFNSMLERAKRGDLRRS